MATKKLVLGDTYYRGLAAEAVDLLLQHYPQSSRPSVAKGIIHCLTDEILESMMIDKSIVIQFKNLIVDELAERHPEIEDTATEKGLQESDHA